MLTNKNSQSTTALNHCVDCILLSSPAASPRVSWRAAEARFYSWRKLLSGHKYFFIHTRASRSDRILLFNIGCNFNGNECDVNLLKGRISVVLNEILRCPSWRKFDGGRTSRIKGSFILAFRIAALGGDPLRKKDRQEGDQDHEHCHDVCHRAVTRAGQLRKDPDR